MTDDPMVYKVMAAFRDRPNFDAHQTRTRDSAWFAATRGILRDFRPEEVGAWLLPMRLACAQATGLCQCDWPPKPPGIFGARRIGGDGFQ